MAGGGTLLARAAVAGLTATAALAAALAAAPAAAQDPPRPEPGRAGPGRGGAGGTIAGRVLGAGDEPLAGAVVRIVGRDDGAGRGGARPPNAAAGAAPGAVTDAAGRFTLRAVPPGVVRVEVRRIGYAPRVVSDVVVRAGKPAEVRVVLEPSAAALAGVTVRPGYFPALPAPATPVSAAAFSAEEIRRAPGVTEDPVRAVSVLPGVAPTTESRNDLVVRGGAPVETLFLVDGVEVPNVNHFGAQGSTGGGVSMLPADFVREASLSAGGFAARWGDRASGVAAFALRDGTRERVAGQLNVAATGAGAFVEGPLGGAAAGASFLAGARRSYLDPLFRALKFDFIPAFRDATVRAAVRPAAGRFARDELSWFAVAGRGTVTVNAATVEQQRWNRDVVAPNQTQYATGLTWRHRLSRGVAAATLGRTDARFETAQQDAGAPGAPRLLLRADTREAETQLRAEVAWTLAGGAVVEAGNVAKFADRLRYDVWVLGALRCDAAGAPHPLAVDTAFRAFRDAAYAQATLPVAPRVRATLGARADHYAFLRSAGDAALRLAPRLSLAWAPDGRSAVTLAGGRYWQAPQPLWLAGDPSNLPSAPGGGVRPFRADHLVLGYQRTPRPDLRVRVEAYAKRYGAYPARVFRPRAVLQPVAFDNALTDIPFGLEPLASAGTGRVVGAELLVQKKLSEVPVYGLAALAVSRARFRALEGPPAAGAFDVPAAATVLGGWRPGGGWELSSRARLAAGAPTTPFVPDPEFGGVPDWSRYGEGPRRPRFFQVDARVDRRFTLRGGRQLVAYVDVINVTGRRNAYTEAWVPGLGRAAHFTTLGRLPSAGLNWAF